MERRLVDHPRPGEPLIALVGGEGVAGQRPEQSIYLTTVVLIGVGFLAIPALTGSAAYAITAVLNLRRGDSTNPFSSARYFYQIVVGSAFVGVLIDFLNINPIKAPFWTAVINGMLAPFLLSKF